MRISLPERDFRTVCTALAAAFLLVILLSSGGWSDGRATTDTAGPDGERVVVDLATAAEMSAGSASPLGDGSTIVPDDTTTTAGTTTSSVALGREGVPLEDESNDAASDAGSDMQENQTSKPASSSPEQLAREDALARARTLGANEMGQVLVLMYHLIGHTKGIYNRTPEQFRQDLADLKTAGYYPINVCDLVSGRIEIPAGKSPVVITFDDSSSGQYRIGADGQVDPDCAVAIMQEAVEQGEWASRASFFPLIYVDAPGHVLFGQPQLKEKKLQQLVSWGYEVGSHTVTHLDLRRASTTQAQRELYESKRMLEEMIGTGYEVTSLAAPFGAYPAQPSLLKSGEYDGRSYSYQAALRADGGACASPFSDRFDAYSIPRVNVSGASLREALSSFDRSPQLRYISDGDSTTISIPAKLDPLLGTIGTGSMPEVVRY